LQSGFRGLEQHSNYRDDWFVWRAWKASWELLKAVADATSDYQRGFADASRISESLKSFSDRSIDKLHDEYHRNANASFDKFAMQKAINTVMGDAVMRKDAGRNGSHTSEVFD
jgi:hypothetical protein